MNNKFVRAITGNGEGIIAARAAQLGLQAKLEQERLVNSLKSDLARVDGLIIRLTDLAPDSRDSLRPGNGFSAADWVAKVQSAKVERASIKEALDIAVATYDEFFTEVPAASTDRVAG